MDRVAQEIWQPPEILKDRIGKEKDVAKAVSFFGQLFLLRLWKP